MKSMLMYGLSAIIIAHAGNSFAKCTLTLTKRSATAKTAYIGSKSVSKKMQDALATQCTINYRMATVEELLQVEREKYERKVRKLKLKQQVQ